MAGESVVIGGIGYDVHNKGARILQYAFAQAGFNTVYLGIFNSPDDFIKAAIETDACAILVSSLYGMAELDCRGFREKCREAGLEKILLYVGGQIATGVQPFEEAEARFRAMGFDRVYPQGTSPRVAIDDLRADLERQTAAVD